MMLDFARDVTRQAELFAQPSTSSNQIADQAVVAISDIFKVLLSRESFNKPLYRNLCDQLVSSRPQTRAQAKKGKQKDVVGELVEGTPLDQLFTQDADDDMLWNQLLLKLDKSQALLKRILGQNDFGIETDMAIGQDSLDLAHAAAEDEDDDDDDDQESEASQESQDQDEASFYQDAEESFQPLSGSSPPQEQTKRKALSLATFDEDDDGPLLKKRKTSQPRNEVDDRFFNLKDFLATSEAGEREMARMLDPATGADSDEDDADDVDMFKSLRSKKIADDDEEDGLDLGAEDDITYEDFFALPADEPRPKPKPKAKADHASSTAQTLPRKRSVRFSDQVRVKPIEPRKQKPLADLLSEMGATEADLSDDMRIALGINGAAVQSFEEDADSDESTEEDAEIWQEAGDDIDDEIDDLVDENEAEEAFGRVQSDLFDQDSDSSDDGMQKLSRHERRMKELNKQIAQLEQENVGKKEWTLQGEARARERPQNSLLEQDLEYESTAKLVPSVTTEMTTSLEDKIKQRILNDQWDDVARKLPFDPKAFLPSRLLDIEATQSGKSLADLYADEYSKDRLRAEGKAVPEDERDVALTKEHKEIEDLFESIANKLDALSNARFTPKPPETRIETRSNLASISMESALPANVSNSTLLAPEEVYKSAKSATSQDKSDMSNSERKAARARARRQKAKDQSRVNQLSGKAGIKTVKAKEAKDRARERLIGTKGVTVIGKGSKKGKKHAK